MKPKHFLILGVIFTLLLGVNIFQKIRAVKNPAGEVRREEWRPLIPQEKVARIVFSRPGFSTMALAKTGSNWQVETLSGVTADTQKITNLLAQLNQMKAELRAEGETLYARFGIADAESFRLQVFDATGIAMLDFFISQHRAGQGIFLRLPGKPKIYFAPDDLPAALGLYGDLEPAGPPPLFFADLRLLPEGFEQIRRFEIDEMRQGKKVTRAALERPSSQPGGEWKFVSNAWKLKVGADKVENYLNKVITAQAENIATTVPEFKTEMEMSLRDERGKVLRLQFSRMGTGWLVRREGATPVYEVSDHVFSDLKIDDAQLVIENPLNFKIDEAVSVKLVYDSKVETFSKESGWASAAVIINAASQIQFLGVDPDVQAKDLAMLPPTHQVRFIEPEKPAVEISFFVTDPKLNEIKTIISGQDQVFIVSKAFFEGIFVPKTLPVDIAKDGPPLR